MCVCFPILGVFSFRAPICSSFCFSRSMVNIVFAFADVVCLRFTFFSHVVVSNSQFGSLQWIFVNIVNVSASVVFFSFAFSLLFINRYCSCALNCSLAVCVYICWKWAWIYIQIGRFIYCRNSVYANFFSSLLFFEFYKIHTHFECYTRKAYTLRLCLYTCIQSHKFLFDFFARVLFSFCSVFDFGMDFSAAVAFFLFNRVPG